MWSGLAFRGARWDAEDDDADLQITHPPRFPNVFKTDFDDAVYPSLLSCVQEMPLFRGCDVTMIESLLNRGDHITLGEGEELVFRDEGLMYIIHSGCVSITSGTAPPRILGVGEALNTVGMLGLISEAEPFRPRALAAHAHHRLGASGQDSINRKRVQEPYEFVRDTGKPPRRFFDAIRPNMPVGEGEDFYSCLHNLCPTTTPTKVKVREPDWVEMKATGAQKNAVPFWTNMQSRPLRGGGAELVGISFSMVQEVGGAAGIDDRGVKSLMQESLRTFIGNAQHYADVWRTIMVRGGKLFPAVPPEIMWNIAEVSQRLIRDGGIALMHEGENRGEGHSSIHIIDEGQCSIEKLIPQGSTAKPTVVGHLGPGAIIGEVCLMKSGVLSPATVRALTSVDVVKIPRAALERILLKYPGMVAGFERRFTELEAMMLVRLPPKLNVLEVLQAFSMSDRAFLVDLASHTERKVLRCGDCLVEQGALERAVHVLEYGSCAVEVAGRGRVAEAPLGSCFGERALLEHRRGRERACDATVSVSSPFAICLRFTLEVFSAVIDKAKYPEERRNFAKVSDETAGDVMYGLLLSRHVQCFNDCDHLFLQKLADQVYLRMYVPGQTLYVEGATDEGQLFLIRSGDLIVEKDGEKLHQLSEGAVLGEGAMLGSCRRRRTTARAISLVHTLEVPRVAFVDTLVQFPNKVAHFEQVALREMRHDDPKPFIFRTAPMRLLFMLNLYGSWHTFAPCEKAPVPLDAVIIIHSGTAERVAMDGKVREALGPGSSFNQQILLGMAPPCERLRVCTTVEVQQIDRNMWLQILGGFDDEWVESIRKSVVDAIADAGQAANGFGGNIDMLRSRSPLFRLPSLAVVDALAGHLHGVVYAANDLFFSADERGQRMYVLVDGEAYLPHTKPHVKYVVGNVLGEAVLIGASQVYRQTVRALTFCAAKTLHRDDLLGVLQNFPGDAARFSSFAGEEHARGDQPLRDHLQAMPGVSPRFEADFISELVQDAEDEFYAPGEVVISLGDPCGLGKSAMYVAMSGVAVYEDQLGVPFGKVHAGDVFGEEGAAGFEETRPYTVRADSDSPLHVLRIAPHSFVAALNQFPLQRDAIEEMVKEGVERHDRFQAMREQWMVKIIPVLTGTALLFGCPPEMLTKIANALVEKTYTAGEVITKAGEAVDTMVCLLDGLADVETMQGAKVGELRGGAAFGEAAVLGLLSTRTGTVRAVKKCRVLPVSRGAFQRGLSLPEAKCTKDKFCHLLVERQRQVERGLPLAPLCPAASPQCIAARAIALQAEALDLQPGQSWDFFPDDGPNGPHYGVLAQGKARLETTHQGRRAGIVYAGTLLQEGLYAKHDVRLVADTRCVGYRISRIDFFLAVAAAPTKPAWLDRFMLLEKDAREQAEMRLLATKGADHCRDRHPADAHIAQWSRRKDAALTRSLHTRSQQPALIALILSSNPRGTLSPLREGQSGRLKWAGNGKAAKRSGSVPAYSVTPPPSQISGASFAKSVPVSSQKQRGNVCRRKGANRSSSAPDLRQLMFLTRGGRGSPASSAAVPLEVENTNL